MSLNSIFQFLVPKDKKFFPLFEQASTNLVQLASHLHEAVNLPLKEREEPEERETPARARVGARAGLDSKCSQTIGGNSWHFSHSHGAMYCSESRVSSRLAATAPEIPTCLASHSTSAGTWFEHFEAININLMARSWISSGIEQNS
jgi:hypothetical protein